MWSCFEIGGLCCFGDGSGERGVCGAGMLTEVFAQASVWVAVHKKCGRVPGQNSLDGEIGGCALLLRGLNVDKCTRGHEVLCGFFPAHCIFRRNALHAGGPSPNPPPAPLGLWVACGSGVRGNAE